LRRINTLLDLRTNVTVPFFAAEADRIARLCHRMAERFARGGRLIAFGDTPAARSDVRHIAVEFVHPVIVGKRALPAVGLTQEGGSLVTQMGLLAEPDDIAIAFGGNPAIGQSSGEVVQALALAQERGCLTVAFSDIGAEWTFLPPGTDPFLHQELVETLYHVLWELVHVFFEHRGLLQGDREAAVHDAGASSFLYPFLARQEHDLDAVIADVRRSVVMKASDVVELRIRTIGSGSKAIQNAAMILQAAFDAGHSALVFGNGGSATDAMDAVADLRYPPIDSPHRATPVIPMIESDRLELLGSRAWTARRAFDLTEDTAILTALANDIGSDALFSRQVIAYGRPGDVVIAFSTSGNSRNVIQALDEARRRGMMSVAFVGYDGGQILTDALADAVVVSPSQYVPRIQEAQATAWHIIRELVG
jgi:D-sedoheptulose 7-phosphate isomerase